MKKRRILSLLLSAVLIISSMPITAMAADRDITLDNDKWGNVTVTTPQTANDARPGDTDGKYLRLYGLDKYASGIIFPAADSTFKFNKEKFYRLTMWMRTMPNTGNDIGDGTNVPSLYFKVGGSYVSSLFGDAGYAYNNIKQKTTITDEWTEYTAIFKPAQEYSATLQIYRMSNKASVVPFDIDAVSFVEVEKNGAGEWVPVSGATELIDLDNYTYNSGHTSPDFTVITDDAYLSMSGAASGNTSFTYSGTETLEPGVYEISGKFRLPVFDYTKLTYNTSTTYNVDANGNTAKLSATLGETALKADNGTDGVTIGNKWTDAKFVIEAFEEVAVSDITFSINGNQKLDFDDIKLKQTTGFSEKYVTNGYKAAVVDDLTDARPGATDGEYLRLIGGVSHCRTYSQNTSLVANTTYVVSFWARTAPQLNAGTLPVLRVLFNGTEKTVGGTPGAIDSALKARPAIPEEWTQYTFSYKPTANTSVLKLELRRFWNATDGGVPIDIDGISIVESGTTENLYTGNGNWNESCSNCGSSNHSDLYIMSANDTYSRVGAGTSSTAFNLTSEDELAPGVYNVSGKFRLLEYNRNDTDGAVLTASVGGTPLSGSVAVTNAWTEGALVLDINTAVKKSDIVFTLDGAYTLDVGDIAFKKADYLTSTGASVLEVVDVREGDADESYLHVSGPKSTGIVYTDTSVTPTDGAKYRITFWARTAPVLNSPADKTGQVTLRLSVCRSAVNDAIQLTEEWTKYTFDFDQATLATGTYYNGSNIAVRIFRHWSAEDSVPFDIDDIVMVQVDAGGNPITGNLLKPSIEWTAYNELKTAGDPDAVVSKAGKSEFYRVAGPSAAFKSADKTVYPAGLYHITGEFKIPEYDFNALDGVTLSANCDGTPIAPDAYGAVINNNWKKVTFFYNAASSFVASDIVFSLSGAHTLDFKYVEIIDANDIYLDSWQSGDGKLIASTTDAREGDTDGEYIRLIGPTSSGRKYIQAANITEGTYTVAFWARTFERLNAINTKESFYEDALYMRVALNGGAEYRAGSGRGIPVYSEWTYYELPLTASTSGNIALNMYRHWYSEDGGAPVEIDLVSIIKNGTSENLYDGSGNWNSSPASHIAGGDLVVVDASESFYRVYAGSENTSINCVENGILAPGVYTISGEFRVPVYDYDSPSANISALLGDVPLSVGSDGTSASVGVKWTKVSATLDLAKSVNMNTIKFALDEASDLDFRNLTIKLVERRVNMSDIDSSVLITLLMLRKQQIEKEGPKVEWKIEGKPLRVVDKVLDEKLQLVGSDNGVNANEYIHFAYRDRADDKLIYKDDNATLTPGTYKISFWARSVQLNNAALNSPVTALRIYNKSIYLTNKATRIVSTGVLYGLHAFQLSSDWSEYSIVYKITEETPLEFSFTSSSSGYGVAPFDIDGLTLVAVDPMTYRPITGENLAVSANLLKGSGAAGWTATEGSKDGAYTTKLEKIVESEYFYAPAPIKGNTVIKGSGYSKLNAGTYYITAKVRLSAVDYSKYIFESAMILAADNNKAELKAYLGDTLLKTKDGADSVTVTPEWTDAIFEINVEKPTSVRMLSMALDSALALDFDYINVDTTVKKDVAVIVTEVEDWDGELPPLPAITSGNLLAGALDADKLPYWNAGEQTLTAGTDEEGNSYLAASDIKSNKLGFTFTPGYTVNPGLYRLSVDVRTSNEGETSIMRMLVNDTYKCYSTAISNEWRTVQMAFEVKESEYLTVKIYGGLLASNVQDYEFKNLKLVDVVAELEGQNLVVDGSLDDASALDSWTIQKQATLTWNEEGYLSVTERPDALAGIVYELDLGFAIPEGTKFKVSYDIRTSNPDETFKVRSFIGSVGLNVKDYAFAYRQYEYYITNEWEHVDSSYVSVGDNTILFKVQGGVNIEDNGDFDIDNLSIEIVR